MTTAPRFTLRPHNDSDRQRLFDWRNDPTAFTVSVTARPVAWTEHVAWFGRLADAKRHLLLMVEDGGETIGWVRFDRQDEQAAVSIMLQPDRTGRGLGTAVLRAGTDAAFARWPIGRIVALILKSNRPSLSAFAKAGFTPAPDQNAGDFLGLQVRRPA